MKQVFIPQETQDSPFDVTLVVADGKEFKAHRRVLSEASPFFEKLFNSGMRESKDRDGGAYFEVRGGGAENERRRRELVGGSWGLVGGSEI